MECKSLIAISISIPLLELSAASIQSRKVHVEKPTCAHQADQVLSKKMNKSSERIHIFVVIDVPGHFNRNRPVGVRFGGSHVYTTTMELTTKHNTTKK